MRNQISRILSVPYVMAGKTVVFAKKRASSVDLHVNSEHIRLQNLRVVSLAKTATAETSRRDGIRRQPTWEWQSQRWVPRWILGFLGMEYQRWELWSYICPNARIPLRWRWSHDACTWWLHVPTSLHIWDLDHVRQNKNKRCLASYIQQKWRRKSRWT